jgi:hypothetical protein
VISDNQTVSTSPTNRGTTMGRPTKLTQRVDAGISGKRPRPPSRGVTPPPGQNHHVDGILGAWRAYLWQPQTALVACCSAIVLRRRSSAAADQAAPASGMGRGRQAGPRGEHRRPRRVRAAYPTSSARPSIGRAAGALLGGGGDLNNVAIASGVRVIKYQLEHRVGPLLYLAEQISSVVDWRQRATNSG